MKPQEPKNLLQHISDLTLDLPTGDQLLVLAYILTRWLRYKIARLTPARILLPVTLIQISYFAAALYRQTTLHIILLGNLLIVAVALIPILLREYKAQEVGLAHWIRPHEQ